MYLSEKGVLDCGKIFWLDYSTPCKIYYEET